MNLSWITITTPRKFPDCVHFFGAWTRQAVIKTIAIVYDSRKELRRNCSSIGHNNAKHFLCPIRSRHPLEFLEIVWWELVPMPGLSFCPYLKTFLPSFLLTQLTAPGSRRMILAIPESSNHPKIAMKGKGKGW